MKMLLGIPIAVTVMVFTANTPSWDGLGGLTGYATCIPQLIKPVETAIFQSTGPGKLGQNGRKEQDSKVPVN